ncbi:MAG: hypothetical protein ABIJ35_13370, partial [Acidobacteriota bacterium]
GPEIAVNHTGRICQYCDKEIKKKDIDKGYRITHPGHCRDMWLKRDVDGVHDYPVCLEVREDGAWF